MPSLDEIGPVIFEKKSKLGKVYRQIERRRTTGDQKSSLEPSIKNTAGNKIVTFLIIREQSHTCTRNFYFIIIFLKLNLYCILLQHVKSLILIMFILFIEMCL